MKRSLLLLLAAAAASLPACTQEKPGPAAVVPAVPNGWRAIATDADKARARKWRTAFVSALTQARAGGHGAEVAREGVLLAPDAALLDATPPAGDYRCRTVKVGAKDAGMLEYVAYPFFDCRIAPGEGGTLDFVKLTGSQRPVGRLFPDGRKRLVFLGTMQLGDERGTLRYGHDRARDMLGLLERIGERRWRLLFPYPAFESTLDVIELVPKE